MDRHSPRQRPRGRNAGTQRWRDLAFFHWPVDVALMRKLVPAPLELDLWDGMALVGLVPFIMHGVRPRWLPERFAFNLLETNVRTYVHVAGQAPGVYFFSLDATSRLAVWAARATFSLPYFFADMSIVRSGAEVTYETRRRRRPDARLACRYDIGAPLGNAQAGSLEEFLIERYLLYVERRSRLMYAQVHHVPYPLAEMNLRELQEGLCQANGLPGVTMPPLYSHYSPGVDVEVFGLRPVTLP